MLRNIAIVVLATRPVGLARLMGGIRYADAIVFKLRAINNAQYVGCTKRRSPVFGREPHRNLLICRSHFDSTNGGSR
jgi:hypothetical protein